MNTSGVTLFFFVLLKEYTNAKSRIFGGFPIKIEQAPYQVALLKDQGHHCGGG